MKKMKKSMMLLLSLALVAGMLGGCAGKPSEPTAAQTQAPETQAPETQAPETQAPETQAPETQAPSQTGQTLDALLTSIYEKATLVYTDGLGDPMPVDLSSDDSAKYFIGIGAGDVEEAIFSEPMMSSQAYSLCLIRVKEGADIEQVKQSVLEGVDPRKWICVTAEATAVMNSDNIVMMVMTDQETVDDVCKAFTEVMGDNVGERLDKYNGE